MLACCFTAVVLAPSTVAASQPTNEFAQAQTAVTYTVYQPSFTAGLKPTSFTLLNGGPPCGGRSNKQLFADFGSQMGKKGFISLSESLIPCADGPDGVGPVTTVTVLGATATIMGSCKGGKSTCANSNPALLRKGQGHITVTLPAGNSTLKPTYVEIDTSFMSLKDIRQFLAGLSPTR